MDYEYKSEFRIGFLLNNFTACKYVYDIVVNLGNLPTIKVTHSFSFMRILKHTKTQNNVQVWNILKGLISLDFSVIFFCKLWS